LTTAAQNDLATFQAQMAELADKDDIIATINVIDRDELQRRYELAIEAENPSIKHTFVLEDSKFLFSTIAETQVVLAAISLKDCINIPGIKNGTLFQKNVRQSLGLNNTVNKGIKNTIYNDKHRDFFFFHNGVTAI